MRSRPMRRPRYISLNVKLCLAIIPLMLVFMAFNFGIILKHQETILQEETEKRALSLATGLSILSAEAFKTFSDYLLQQNVDQFSRLKDVVAASIVDQQGRILAHTDARQRSAQDTDSATLAAIQTKTQQVKLARDQLEVWKPIMIEDRCLGAVRITLSLQGMMDALASSQRYLEGLTLLLLAGSVIFVGFLARWFTEPLLRLARVSRDLARGDLSSRAVTVQLDEVGLLGAALNHMADRVETLIDKEKEAHDKLQFRVATLLAFTNRVIGGDFSLEATPGEQDEMGQLTTEVNEMVRHLRILLEDERSMRETVERARHELEEANEKLKELDQLKSEFLNTVSHELRTPLTSIKAFAEILLDNEGEDMETQMEFLGIINKESDRLTRLINNLLDLSRIEAGRMNWAFEPVDLREITEVACTSLKVSADKKGVHFDVEIPDVLPTVGDYDKLVQVITNLVGNAIKFTPEGGRIVVKAGIVNGLYEIMVQDSGMGIAPEHHAQIFEKFGQVDTGETREIKGSGLGLPIARSIVVAHGGTLTVESEKGEGSRFYVRMPIEVEAMSEESRTAPEAEEPQASLITKLARPVDGEGPRTVMVVDDEMHIRRFLRHLLEAEGFKVLEARTGRDAIALAREQVPDVMLLDLMLPDINGFDVLKEIKEQEETRNVSVIMLSIIQDREKGYRLGASDYLSKPIDREKLLDRIARYVGGRPASDLLVVEDDDSVLKAIRVMLESHGYKVRTSPNGEGALVEVAAQAPDLILLDLMLPGLTGHDVLQELKRKDETAEIPVIVLTAAGPDERTKALGMGADHVMTKPFTENELARLVRELLAEETAR